MRNEHLIKQGVAEATAALEADKAKRYPHTNESACAELDKMIASLKSAKERVRRKRWRDSEKAMQSSSIQRSIDALYYARDALS